MDEMKVSSRFMQRIIENLITKMVKKKTGYSPDLTFCEPIRVTFDDEVIKLHVNLDAALTKDELSFLVANLL